MSIKVLHLCKKNNIIETETQKRRDAQMELITLQIDLGRQKETIEYIKSYVDFAKASGYNSIFYYIENAVRTPDTEFLDPEETYSLDEMREIVEYTEGVGLMAIPAFENLGHMEKFLSYPALRHLAETPGGVGARFPRMDNGDCGCMSNPDFYAFIDKYVSEVAAVFRAPYIHMGLDEVFSFAVCPRCRARMKRDGLRKADLFYEHIMHTYNLVKSLGREMMMWDDFFECMDIVDRLPRDIIMTTWYYVFAQDEISGHWTNRPKRDAFAYYDELGFRYIMCTLGTRASSVYNLETFASYAGKHKPMGALMTTWERAADFYFCTYPVIAYAGRLWSEGADEEKRLRIYTDIIGDEECARLILSLNIPYTSAYYPDIIRHIEADFFAQRLQRDQLRYAIEFIRARLDRLSGREHDVLADLYVFLYKNYAECELGRLGTVIFNKYECPTPDFSTEAAVLDKLIAGFAECEELERALWQKYRHGIKSTQGQFDALYKGYRERLEGFKRRLGEVSECGVIYTDLMLHDGYCTARCSLTVKYEGAEEEQILYTGGAKSGAVGLEVGNCYTLRDRCEARKVEYIKFSTFGEGALYPLHFRYKVGGKKYVADTVEVISGEVEHAENMLTNDTRFALMGNNNSLEHFEDIELSKVMHTVKVTFKPLSEYRYI